MSEPKLNIKEETSAKKTRSPPKKAKAEQTVPKKKKLKTDADKAAEKAQHLRFGKAELTPDELSRLSKAQKREMYAAHAARSAVHHEVDQYEDENVGVQALSESEKAAGNVRDISKSRYARKLKKKAKMQGKKGARTAKSSVQKPTAAQDAGASGTSEGGSNWLSRWKQRQEIHKSYYTAARSGTAAQTAGGKAASNGASAARSGVEQAVEKGKTAVSTAVKGLANAAKGNAHVLVIVGVFLLLINASRLFSCLYGQPLAVGRVMTPVLAMTVVREAAIAAFVPEKFYTVDLELTSGCTASSRRIPEKSVAENLLEACRREMVATIQRITRKEKSENPPLLYDLTTLQRDANRLLGYSAQQTLDYVQSLYEKKLTTYPRTDSCYITDDDEEMLEELTEELEGFLGITPEDMDEAVPRTRRTVNREKVTDHHAILPTRSMLQADLDALPKGEQNVLKLIIARTLMAVSKPFRYLETLLTTECAGEEFTAKGKEVLEEGWKAVERKVLADILNRKQELTALPNAAENECGILNAELKEGQTSPPKHFTEDTLLHAMETASADSMPEGVERQGIGTPATRAATIEKLVQKGFLERKGTKKNKVLLPTDKGKALITVMPEEIQSPEMTADWETKLLRIERSEMEPGEFMTEINTMITELVKNTEMKKGANALMKSKIIGVCPNCGKPVVEREKGWFCENRECRFVLWKDNAFFKRLGKRLDAHVADKLLRDGRVRLKDCKSAKGKTYNATVLLSCEADGRSKFSLEFEGGC